MKLRIATEDDRKLIWEWANDPVTRELSFDSEIIPWAKHLSWFKEKLSDTECVFLLGLSDSGIPLGQVRFDIENKDATISISIDKDYRGAGYGSKLIRMASDYLFEIRDVKLIKAYIKKENKGSIRAFEKAGYGNLTEIKIKNHMAYLMTFLRNKN